MTSSGSCPFHTPCSCIAPALGRDVGVSPPSLTGALLLPGLCCGAGTGLTVVQTQQLCVLRLPCHLACTQFCLLIIQFTTSVTEIKCQQKEASTSHVLQQILTTGDWFSAPPEKKDPLLFTDRFSFCGQSFVPLLRPSARRPVAGFNWSLTGLVLVVY